MGAPAARRAEVAPPRGAPPEPQSRPAPRPAPHRSLARRITTSRALAPVAFALCLVPLALLAWRAWRDALGANPIRELEIQTGLWTLRLLAVTLAVTPARRLLGWGFLVRYRRLFGLFTFFYATVHLSAFLALDMAFDLGDIGHEIVKHKYITVGMASWLLLVPLAMTSTRGWIRRLGPEKWNQLHRLVYAVAAGGTVHYLWAVKKDTLFPLLYLTTFAALLAYRAVARARDVRRRRAGSIQPTADS